MNSHQRRLQRRKLKRLSFTIKKSFNPPVFYIHTFRSKISLTQLLLTKSNFTRIGSLIISDPTGE